MVSNTFYKSIGGGHGSMPINSHANDLNATPESAARNCSRHVSHDGEEASEPNRAKSLPHGRDGFNVGDGSSSGASAMSGDKTKRVDKMRKNGKVKTS